MSVPESQNMYAYAHNNPLKFVDPSGECVETLWDVLNVIYDLGKISNGYISGNQYAVSAGYTDLGADLFALAIPGLPAGITKFRGINGFTKSVKPSLSDHKKALKKVQQEVGALPKGKLGKFGSPQAGDRKKGYRLDPPHNGAAKGSAESKYHINWWDYTNGKRGKGGRSGAVSIDD